MIGRVIMLCQKLGLFSVGSLTIADHGRECHIIFNDSDCYYLSLPCTN
jgi:hypothetical protein